MADPTHSDRARIRPWREGDQRECERILRDLPEWFGIEAALVRYADDTRRHPTWIAADDAGPVGFVTALTHSPRAAEVYVIAVAKRAHRAGVGRALLEHASSILSAQGVRFLQVKTLGPSKPNAAYAETLKFYLAMGFVPLEEFSGVWPGMPCLVLVKTIGA